MWNLLRGGAKKHEAASPARSKTSSLLRKFAGSDQFQQKEFAAFIRTLKQVGIEFLPIDGFVTRYQSHYSAPQPGDAKFGHLKFDIHGDIVRPVEMARTLNMLGVHGLFLIMHRHALNEDWYGTPRMWDALKEIRGLGHEVGLHVDPFHLITTHDDLYAGIDAALEDFTKQGFAMRAMTLHGDSRPHIKARKLQANDFFRDGFRKSKWDGLPPEGQEKLADHVRRYKHRKIYRKCGIDYVADANLVHQGKLIVTSPMLYLSDNQRRLRIGHIEAPVKANRTFEAPELFTITPDFAMQAAKILARRPFLALFHPQWYR